MSLLPAVNYSNGTGAIQFNPSQHIPIAHVPPIPLPLWPDMIPMIILEDYSKFIVAVGRYASIVFHYTSLAFRYSTDCFSFHRIFSWMYGLQRGSDGSSSQSSQPNNDPERLSPDTQWESAFRGITTSWLNTIAACTIIMPSAIALLQIDHVFDNILTRAGAILVFWLSGAAATSAVAFLAFQEHIRTSKSSRWITASERPDESDSIDFWVPVAWPATAVFAAALLCLAILFSLLWVGDVPSSPNGPAPDESGGPTSGTWGSKIALTSYSVIIFASFVIILTVGQLCRVFKFINT